MDLTAKKCVACEGGVDPLSQKEAETYLSEINDAWDIDERAKMIHRRFSFKNFAEAMKFVNDVADIAETEGHHPDIAISYNKVDISLTTHAIDGLSENDFIVAAKIDSLRNTE